MDQNIKVFEHPNIRMRVLRQVIDIKQAVFAKYLKISTTTLRKWENIDCVLSQKHRNRLHYVGIYSQWIEYGTGELFQYDIKTIREKILFTINLEQNQNRGKDGKGK